MGWFSPPLDFMVPKYSMVEHHRLGPRDDSPLSLYFDSAGADKTHWSRLFYTGNIEVSFSCYIQFI